MDVILNGETVSIADSLKLDQFIEQLDLKGKFAVELNQNIIPRSEYNTTLIKPDDTIEIVEAIGGG